MNLQKVKHDIFSDHKLIFLVLEIPPDFHIEHGILNFHLWLLVDRLKKIDVFNFETIKIIFALVTRIEVYGKKYGVFI